MGVGEQGAALGRQGRQVAVQGVVEGGLADVARRRQELDPAELGEAPHEDVVRGAPGRAGGLGEEQPDEGAQPVGGSFGAGDPGADYWPLR